MNEEEYSARPSHADGEDPQVILDASSEAMSVVGQRFDEKEYYLPELIIAGDDAENRRHGQAKTAILLPSRQSMKGGHGTVAGDIHDIGKDVVFFMLDVNGFEIHDLGVDVAPGPRRQDSGNQSGHRRMRDSDLGFDQMKRTVMPSDGGAARRVKIMIGGAIMDE